MAGSVDELIDGELRFILGSDKHGRLSAFLLGSDLLVPVVAAQLFSRSGASVHSHEVESSANELTHAKGETADLSVAQTFHEAVDGELTLAIFTVNTLNHPAKNVCQSKARAIRTLVHLEGAQVSLVVEQLVERERHEVLQLHVRETAEHRVLAQLVNIVVGEA